MSTAIEFNNISKLYRLGLVSSGTLSNDLKRWWQMNVMGKEDPFLQVGSVNDRSKAADSDYVWALKDIDFKVEQGDVLGIIGKNGAGKSTLLKLLSKVTAPTTGSIRAKGRIASLLEVGTGFHGELTGRENIYMNGAILGMSKQEINSKIDEIIDFSGCERYIDTPVKRYSSGMTVRLGFAVAAHLDPEILVVDEVLAVGDAEFQKKAIGKMQDVSKGEGRTVLFVSHNMSSIRKLCKSGIVLKNGSIDYMGTADDCVDYYIGENLSDLYGYTEMTPEHHRDYVMKEMEYLSVRMLNDCMNVSNEEPLRFVLRVRRNEPKIDRCQFGVVILNNSDVVVGAMYSEMVELPKDTDMMEVELTLPNHYLARGKYSLSFNMSYNDFNSKIRDLDVVGDVIRFEVIWRDEAHTQPFTMWNLGDISYASVEPVVKGLRK